MSAKMKIPDHQMKVLHFYSGGVCAMCNLQLALHKKDGSYGHIGKMAHIQGENSGSARYNPNMTDEERQSYNNLILLCPTCHDKIDGDEKQYTVEYLLQQKSEHETKIKQVFIQPINDLNYGELGLILKYLTSNQTAMYPNYSDYNPILPNEKIRKNKLSNSTADYITMGLNRFKLLQDYLNGHSDIYFAENLRKTFVDKYREIKEKYSDGDTIFNELWEFASLNRQDKIHQAAGLTIVTYFFHECEIFEK